MKSTLSIQDVLEIHRITCGEQNCSPEQITSEVAKMAADQVAENDDVLGSRLRETAEEMDQPVSLSAIRASLQSWGLQ